MVLPTEITVGPVPGTGDLSRWGLFEMTTAVKEHGQFCLITVVAITFAFLLAPMAQATVTQVSVQAPSLSQNGTANLTSPVHFQATAESDVNITGYVVYVDGQNVFRNFVGSVDAWVVLAPGNHSVYIKAWDSSGAVASTVTYAINIVGAAPPTPPSTATRKVLLDQDSSIWVVDNNPNVGGQCNDGFMGNFPNSSDPNTENSPDTPHSGLHLMLTSKCQYDDSLFFRKDDTSPYPYAADTNYLWDFWFYIPTTVQTSYIQALENDMFSAVQLGDGVHWFMFGSQCVYWTNQLQLWLPQDNGLAWVNAGVSPCQFTQGSWHHATFFLQRVTSAGYQEIPAKFSPSSDTNSYLRFGTFTIDGTTWYLGGLSFSTMPKNWAPTLGVQHQLDSAKSGVTLEEFVDKESLTVW